MLNFAKAERPKFQTFVFTDWDDTEIGRVDIPAGTDARPILNEYIKTHMIHPELQGRTNFASLERTDNYRGKYPHAGPAPLGATEGTVVDGERYKLTNKLDYKFVTGKASFEGDKVIVTDLPPDDPYPYLHGWMLVRDIANPPWTTIGSRGELEKFEHRKRAVE